MGVDEAEAAIFDALEQLALRARDSGTSGEALNYALAVRALAESRAWLRDPSQPHSGADHRGSGDDTD